MIRNKGLRGVFGGSRWGWTNGQLLADIARSSSSATKGWRQEWIKFENIHDRSERSYKDPTWTFSGNFVIDNIKKDKRLAYWYIQTGHDSDAWGAVDTDSGAPTEAMFWESQYQGSPANGPAVKTILE